VQELAQVQKPSLRRGEARGGGRLGTGALAMSARSIKPFANTDEFYRSLGGFFAAWSRTELVIDCAIWKALGTETPEEAHERSAGTTFSDKCKQLRALIDDGKVPHKVRKMLDQIENDSLRNVFAHSILASDEHMVLFIHRKIERPSKQYRTMPYRLTRDEFLTHVAKFAQLSINFEQATGLTDKEVGVFASMALPK
jgi:hypothetical protein